MTALAARSTVEVLVLVAAGLAALVSIAHYIRKAFRASAHAVQSVADFAHRLEKVVVNVEAQLYPNGGHSLRDAVNRVERSVADIQRHLSIDAEPPRTNTRTRSTDIQHHPNP